MRSNPLLPLACLLLSGSALWAGEITLENEHLRVSLDRRSGAFSVLDKQAGVRWVPFTSQAAVGATDVALMGVQRGVSYAREFGMGKGRKLKVRVQITVPDKRRDVCVAITADNDAEVGGLAWPPALVPEKGESSMALAPYGNGLLLPLRRDRLPRMWWRSDMPFFGITNVEAGWGYDCIFETPDDARMAVRPVSEDKDAKVAVGVAWMPSMRKWGYTRKLLYRFCPTGGYVALAKAYRAHAKDAGLLVTLREKMKRRPAVAKLAGAPDVWGAKGLAFCQEAKAAGIDRMIVNGSFGVEDTEAIKKLGYLVSCYDNYEDMMAGKPGRYGDCTIPDDAPLMANGKRMLGWPVHVKDPKTGKTKLDPKTGKPILKEQFHKRCSALDLAVARRWIPPDQAKHPRDARFLDVTTATGLRECFDPKHRCTRSIDREHRQKLAAYVSEELGLVCGGEHGKWWGVPFYDYWEGMQSAGFYSWPAGHVGMDIPQKREDIGANYLAYGIGHVHRIPLWELVFGDCVVSTWYWGDSTGHLYSADPDISRRKDLFNMLYATVPLYWVSRPFSFRWDKPELRARLLDSYRVTCKLHEQTSFDELLTHEWLTPDRSVQKTTFSSGTLVVVNFGAKPYSLKDQGKAWLLSPLGFYARGPKVHQYRIDQEGRQITWIRTPDYLFADGGGAYHDFGPVRTAGPMTARTLDDHRFVLDCRLSGKAVEFYPTRLLTNWELTSTHVFLLDKNAQRVMQVTDPAALKDNRVSSKRVHKLGRLEVVCGKESDLPNLCAVKVSWMPSRPRQGEKLRIHPAILNTGRATAHNVRVDVRLGAGTDATVIATRRITLPGGRGLSFTCHLDTTGLDGRWPIVVEVDPKDELRELIETDNRTCKAVRIRLDPSQWRYRLGAELANGPVEQPADTPVVLAVDFGEHLKRVRAGGALDPHSIRVCNRDEGQGSLQTQFDAAPDLEAKTNAKGEVVFLAPKLAPGETKPLWLLFDTIQHGRKRVAPGGIWDRAASVATTADYAAVFRGGTIVELARIYGGITEPSFLTGLVYSSQQTGWVREEGGEVLEQEVLANGPVRAVVRVRKRLKEGLVYTKTYTFWPDRIDVHFEGNKAYGLMSRAYYALPGTYEDSAGNRARVDGAGDAEGVLGKCPNPKWYVVYGDGWAHSCVALSKFDNIIYWDGNSWGGIGFQGGDIKGARMSYVIHGGQKDSTFGKRDYERLMHPPKARIVE